MIQQIIIVLIFAVAIGYLGRMVFRSFKAKEGCEADCKCGVAGDVKIRKVKATN